MIFGGRPPNVIIIGVLHHHPQHFCIGGAYFSVKPNAVANSNGYLGDFAEGFQHDLDQRQQNRQTGNVHASGRIFVQPKFYVHLSHDIGKMEVVSDDGKGISVVIGQNPAINDVALHQVNQRFHAVSAAFDEFPKGSGIFSQKDHGFQTGHHIVAEILDLIAYFGTFGGFHQHTQEKRVIKVGFLKGIIAQRSGGKAGKECLCRNFLRVETFCQRGCQTVFDPFPEIGRIVVVFLRLRIVRLVQIDPCDKKVLGVLYLHGTVCRRQFLAKGASFKAVMGF